MKNSRARAWIPCALVALLVAAGCGAKDDSHQLQALFDEVWAFELKEDPLFATTTGFHEYNDRLPSMRLEDIERRAAYRRSALERLERIDRARLNDADGLNYDLFAEQLRDELAQTEFRAFEIPLTVDSGFHIGFARLPNQVPLASVKDYENYIARLGAFPGYVDQHMALMRAGLARGFTLARVVLEGYEVTIASHIVQDPAASVFYAPFASFPTGVPEAERERLRQAGISAVREAVVPGYQAFLEFMTGEYIPGARTTLGAYALPGGREYYAYLIRHFTTLEVGAEEVHQIGLREVERIQSEMMEVMRQVGFDKGFPAFLQFLRTDPRFYAKTPEELLKEASYIAKRMDGKLPALFKTLPRLPYSVEPVPDHLAPKYTAGRYVGAPIGGTQPGYYWVNTYNLPSRSMYTLEALTLHEAVPGHHLQNALRQELTGLPEFRRFSGNSAFGEGWGLYSEWLGIEAGFYTDPYSNFGRLTYEMWRACRLVVDTGIHAMGWTREQAMEYLATRTALSLHEVRTETDRYISWPGQALAYKMGELKIRELRAKAEQALGARFDLREFHDTVLLQGSIPLTVLQDQVDDYIRRASATTQE